MGLDRSGKRREPTPEVDAVAHAVIGAALEVHKALGPGYLEAVYEEALCVELRLRQIEYKRQHPVQVMYKGYPVSEGWVDIFASELLVVELKAIEQLLPIHSAQVISYLKATRSMLGLLINFNVPVLRQGIKRIILS